MLVTKTAETSPANTMKYAKSIAELMKLRLSFLVVFSAVVSFAMASKSFSSIDWTAVLLLVCGGFLVTGASNGFNQIIEKDLDKLMNRTQQRPLPQERLGVVDALIFSSISGVLGIWILWHFMNPLSGILGLVALVSYVLIYTPLKRITPFAVFVGAFPGAIPPMLGWVAATNDLGLQALVLFSVQFIWQFPHFWSLAWVLDDDYKKAGFRLLPSPKGRSKATAIQILIYNVGLIPISLLPFAFKMSGIISAVICVVAGLFFLYKAWLLFKSGEVADARKLMFASFIYLPIVQLALMFDKI
jgi:protoheme IX farnesyltransferase